MNKKIFILAGLLLTTAGFVGVRAFDFNAPIVYDRTTVEGSAQSGLIVYDTSDNAFYGRDTVNSWKKLSVDTTYTNVRTITTNYTVDASDDLILCDASSGDVTIYLPEVVSTISGKTLKIRKIDNSDTTSSPKKCILDADSTQTIDGSLTKNISTFGEVREITADFGGSTDWRQTSWQNNTGWNDYTPSLDGFSGTATASWRRVGPNMEIRALVVLNAAVTAPMKIYVPSGYSMKTASSVGGLGVAGYVGTVVTFDNGGSVPVYQGAAYSTVSDKFTFYGGNGQNAWNATVPYTWASGDSILMTVSVPISGWEF